MGEDLSWKSKIPVAHLVQYLRNHPHYHDYTRMKKEEFNEKQSITIWGDFVPCEFSIRSCEESPCIWLECSGPTTDAWYPHGSSQSVAAKEVLRKPFKSADFGTALRKHLLIEILNTLRRNHRKLSDSVWRLHSDEIEEYQKDLDRVDQMWYRKFRSIFGGDAAKYRILESSALSSVPRIIPASFAAAEEERNEEFERNFDSSWSARRKTMPPGLFEEWKRYCEYKISSYHAVHTHADQWSDYLKRVSRENALRNVAIDTLKSMEVRAFDELNELPEPDPIPGMYEYEGFYWMPQDSGSFPLLEMMIELVTKSDTPEEVFFSYIGKYLPLDLPSEAEDREVLDAESESESESESETESESESETEAEAESGLTSLKIRFGESRLEDIRDISTRVMTGCVMFFYFIRADLLSSLVGIKWQNEDEMRKITVFSDKSQGKDDRVLDFSGKNKSLQELWTKLITDGRSQKGEVVAVSAVKALRSIIEDGESKLMANLEIHGKVASKNLVPMNLQMIYEMSGKRLNLAFYLYLQKMFDMDPVECAEQIKTQSSSIPGLSDFASKLAKMKTQGGTADPTALENNLKNFLGEMQTDPVWFFVFFERYIFPLPEKRKELFTVFNLDSKILSRAKAMAGGASSASTKSKEKIESARNEVTFRINEDPMQFIIEECCGPGDHMVCYCVHWSPALSKLVKVLERVSPVVVKSPAESYSPNAISIWVAGDQWYFKKSPRGKNVYSLVKSP